MCNELHHDSTPINESGFGWKIFNVDKQGNFYSLVFEIYFENGEAQWNKEAKEGSGFCFFLTKEEAERAKIAWENRNTTVNCVVKKIAYHGGLGKHQERSFIYPESFETALCTKFKVLEEE